MGKRIAPGALLATALLSAACGSDTGEPGFSAMSISISTRSMSALGDGADSCSCLLFYGFEFDGFAFPVQGDETSALFGGLEPGDTETTFTLTDSAGLPVAEGWTGLSLVEGDTTPVYLRARFHRITSGYDIEVEAGAPSDPGRPGSILFVGNSYTYANGGMDSIFTLFCESADPQWSPATAMYAVGGYTLEDHYGDPSCLGMISRGWDLVILQEQSTRPVESPELMWEYASLLADAIEDGGARPGFFMTWAREYDPSMTEPLDSAYSHAGALVDGMVSPVGLAWAIVRRTMPGLDLYEKDGSHPNRAGTYLAVCTIYSAITGESPAGVEYCCDPSLTPEERLVLQESAHEAVLEYGQADWRHY